MSFLTVHTHNNNAGFEPHVTSLLTTNWYRHLQNC